MSTADKPFEPNERERQLVEHAQRAAERDRTRGAFVSPELGRRMQDEAELSDPQADNRGDCRTENRWEFYVKLCAELEDTLPTDQLLQRLGNSFMNAAIFRRRPYLLAVECSVLATSAVGARIEVERAIQRVFPGARSVDVEGWPATLIASLNALADEGPLGESEFNHEMSTLYRLRADATFGEEPGPLAAGEVHPEPEKFWIEATVFEVLTHVDHVHLRSEDERIFVITRFTPVLRGTQPFSEGQRFRLLVARRLNAVVRAELIPTNF